MKHLRLVLCIIIAIISTALHAECSILAEISAGELVDKITILEIKLARIHDEEKLLNVRTELHSLMQTYCNNINHALIADLVEQLKYINEQLWDIEDAIRDKERTKEFDDSFISLARAVYYTNDARSQVKRNINKRVGSRLIEEKSYRTY